MITYYKKIKKILFAKKIFSKPKECKVLIYDRQGSHNIKKFFKKNLYQILDTRFESVYIVILIKSLIKYNFRWKPFFYLIELIKKINPSFIITWTDNDSNFYKLKKFYKKNIKTAFIQNGTRSVKLDIFEKLKKKDKTSFAVDLMFVFNHSIGRLYSSFIQGEFIPIGSLRNNFYKKKKIKRKKDVMFISQYLSKNELPISYKAYNKILDLNKMTYECLKEFCEKNNLTVKILTKNNFDGNPTLYNQEIDFYKNIDNKVKIIHKNNKTNVYKLTDSFKIVATNYSTLGYESFSRGNRTAFFSFSNFGKDHKFGWPANYKKTGPFWTSSIEKKKIFKILKFLFTISDSEWHKLYSKYSNKLMSYDYGNKIFRDKITNLII